MNCKSSLTFSTRRDLQEYCETHVMRPDTEWEITSTGERGRGPRGGMGKRETPAEAFLPKEELYRQEEGWSERITKILWYQTDKKMREALVREQKQHPDIVANRIKTVLGNTEAAVRSGEVMRIFGSALKNLRAKKSMNKEKRRAELLRVLELPEQELGAIQDCKTVGNFRPEKIRQMEETFRFLHSHANAKILERTCVRIFASPGKYMDETSACTVRLLVSHFPGSHVYKTSYLDYNGKESARPENLIYVEDGSGRATLAHEMGHALANSNPAIRKMCDAFFEERTRNEKAIPLSKATLKYFDEGTVGSYKCKADHFVDPYCGKLEWRIDPATGKKVFDSPSEIFSCGIELLYGDLEMFYDADPEYFRLIIQGLQMTPKTKQYREK